LLQTGPEGVPTATAGPSGPENALEKSGEHGPWNPGIRSQLPGPLLPLATIFRAENVLTSLEEARERSAFTGLEPEDLVTFRPERLVVHELLIRVTADISVPDGPFYEDLGINFRRIAGTILSRYLEPRMPEIRRAYDELHARALRMLEAELAKSLSAPMRTLGAGPEPKGVLRLLGLARSGNSPRPPCDSIEDRERRMLAAWQREAEGAGDPLTRATYGVLGRLASAVLIRHGRLRGDRTFLAALAAEQTCNEHGSDLIGRLIEPHVREAAAREGYRLVPAQPRPVVMNTKGASASGKSTMRPLQRRLAEELGLCWSDFAVISPDIWRKFLLDYGSLGAASKYAATLTGHELKLIDQKLDRYMAQKAERAGMSHLLIDRFRFDSFALDPDEEEGSRLLTRFGRLVYMFFMITPPEATVERAWVRGQQVGRYKAVDDLLAHNVEAYTGMPRLFFTWAAKKDKTVHYEFLDNDVPEGERPRTVAFGADGEMNILDIKRLIDVERYRKINIDARRPEDVYPDASAMAPERNLDFLLECVRRIPAINFVERDTGRVYARIESGQMTWADAAAFEKALDDPDARAGLLAVAPSSIRGARNERNAPPNLVPDRVHTLGRWGSSRHSL
jgi:hypothetical protein